MSDDAPPESPKRTSVDTRFKPGQSGNPGGRPKGAKNRSTLVEKALDAPIIVTENGRKKEITKWEAAVIQQVNKAAAGDRHAFKIVDEMRGRYEKNKATDAQKPLELPVSTESLTEEETAKLYAEALKKAKSNE
jgi:hypothetical protein